MSTTTTARRTGGLTRRQRIRLVRGVQYAAFLGVGLLIAVKADWPRLSHDYFNLAIARQLFPDILSTALKNTAIYTAMGFVFGLGLGLVLALMRLSEVAPYRWVANVYIEFFRGIPLLLWLFFLGYGVPTATGAQLPGQPYSPIVLGLGMPAAAYMAETIQPCRHSRRTSTSPPPVSAGSALLA